MYNEVLKEDISTLKFIADRYNTQEGKEIKAVRKGLYMSGFVPLYLHSQNVCNKAGKKCLWSLVYVSACYKWTLEMQYENYSHVVPLEPQIYDKVVDWRDSYLKHRQTDGYYVQDGKPS